MIKKKILQKKTINNIVTDNYRKSLSIQFSLDGFSFCITNFTTKEIHHFTTYSFDNSVATPNELLDEIETLFKDNSKLLSQDFDKVVIIHQNNLSTLVPTPFFNENELKTYLDYNIKTLENDFIAFDSLEQIDTKNVYVPYVNINNFFFQHFGEFEYKHHSTVLIEKLISLSKNNKQKQFFVNVTNQSFDIVVVEDSKLLFYNSFTFSTKEDFIYYILFTAEQLNMNPEELLLFFSGDIEEASEIYHITYQYIRNVAFLNTNNKLFEKEENISAHSNFIITP
jgi:hypothetical protein